MRLSRKKLYYLASPYSHPDDIVRYERFKDAERFTAGMLERGFNIYSPIVYNHEMAETYRLPTTWEFWEGVDRKFLRACQEMLVMQIPGWKESRGVQAEIKIAKRYGMPVYLIKVDQEGEYNVEDYYVRRR